MPHPSVTPDSSHFVGLDVGDRVAHLRVVDAERSVVEYKKRKSCRDSLLEEPSGRGRRESWSRWRHTSRWMSSLLRE